MLEKDYDRVALHPDSLSYEAREPARVMPDPVFEIAHEELVEKLRYKMRERDDESVPPYP